MKIGMVAGEASGDYLAAGLIRALKALRPDIHIEGVGGPKMEQEGAQILYSMDTISIMGMDGLAKSLGKILAIRRELRSRFQRHPPDVFIGVDVPDFNLTLERHLRAAGVPTVHYVSPTVWAWREYRVRKIRRSVDLMLTLFPFEERYYHERDVPAVFVGHPLADEIPVYVDREAARRTLGVDGDRVVALLPGSRVSELERLGRLFVDVAARLHRDHHGELTFLAPFASAVTLDYFRRLLEAHAPEVPVRLLQGQSRQVLAASDLALLASGTAALEAALHKVPMVVTYKVSWFTSIMVRLFARVRHFSMPNHLLDEPVVPELMQHAATADAIGAELERFLGDEALRQRTERVLARIPDMLRQGASDRAAQEILALVRRRQAA